MDRTWGDDIFGGFKPRDPSTVRSEAIKNAREELREIKRRYNLTDADIQYIINTPDDW